jgi:hypothetical protein
MRILVLLVSVIPCLLAGQINVDFESGIPDDWVFPEIERWGLDSINPLTGSYSLKHIFDNSEAGSDIAYFPLRGLRMGMDKASWKFRIRHGYNPSSSNNWSVILSSETVPDKHIAGGTTNGIILGVNISGYDDTLRLWKMSGGSLSVILSTNINWQNDIGPGNAQLIYVERQTDGTWSVYIESEGEDRFEIGTGSDESVFVSEYFGLLYNYTSSFDKLLWIDDIEVSGYFEEDNIPPEILNTEFTSIKSVRIFFSEPLSDYRISESSFLITPGNISPVNVVLNQNVVVLSFAEPLENKSIYNITLAEIYDNHGNSAYNLNIDIVLAFPEWGDIIITEVMPDPEPSVDLPQTEYIEIFNRSLYPFNLRSLSLYKSGRQYPLPDFVFYPSTYLLICDNDAVSEFDSGISVIGLISMPSLNNSSDYICLCDTLSGTIHGIDYNNSWLNNHLKQGGGWSFEMIDTDFPFCVNGNWKYSVDKRGGTPGCSNSVDMYRPDNEEPYIENCYALSPSALRINFSEPVTELIGLSKNIQVAGYEIENILKLDSLRRSYLITMDNDFVKGEIYTIDFTDIYDYGSNILNPGFCLFGLAQKPVEGEIIINEVLFEPLPGGSEYIEFFNRSDRLIDAGSMQVTCVNLQSMDTGTVTLLSEEPRCILPGDYFVITEDRLNILESYFNSDKSCIYQSANLTSLPDSKGRILLMKRDLTILDDFSYYDDFHNDLLSGTSGISLERISPDINTNNPSNWHSATGISGWGTPGLENSVADILTAGSKTGITLSSSRISPDNDGYEDFLIINLNLEDGEWIVDIIIYDDSGCRVNILCENMSAYGKEKIIWQGTDNNSNLLPGGIYIVFVRGVSSKGEVYKWKKVCSILRR